LGFYNAAWQANSVEAMPKHHDGPRWCDRRVIRRGCACVRLIEAVDVLLRQKLDQHELVTLPEARCLAVQRLR
jgi:hypothetical protein